MENEGLGRDISLYKYLDVLQDEYLIAELRRKIYIKAKDKQYYSRVMEYKKKKIEDISERNSLPSIFNNSDEGVRRRSLIYPKEGGFPNFIYKDDEERQNYEDRDIYNYYSPGSEVKIATDREGGFMIGVISGEKNRQIIPVVAKGSKESLNFPEERITRIL